MDDNFKFFGFPENNEIEINDPAPKKKINSLPEGFDPAEALGKMQQLSPEMLRQLLPDELLDAMEKDGFKLEDAVSQIKMITPNSLGDMLAAAFGVEDTEEECEDEPEEDTFVHPLIDTKYLIAEEFGSVLVKESETLYDEFIDAYGTDSTKYLDSNVGVKLSVLDAITAQLPFANIKDLKFVENNNRFILYYAEPDIPELYGFFVGFFKDENDQFVLYIPKFGNTFYVDENNNVSLYKPSEHPELFKMDPKTKTADFEYLALSLLNFAMYYASAPQKKVLMAPTQFGTIKNTMPSVKKASRFLRVGTITSNESPEAILLKKDAELDLNEKKFPLYFNFGKVVSEGPLQEIAQAIFKTDLNKSLLMSNSELKYTSDHRLYIDVDLGDI